MSVALPAVVVSLGSVVPPAEDVVSLNVHCGCTKEVSSFEVVLQNWNGKYSPGAANQIVIGSTGGIGVCRAPNNPVNSPVISLRVERIDYQSSPLESYVSVSGRCWGEKLFRRVVTKTYENKKGEYIVKDLLDNYVGLSHTRNSVELVENTDTTYGLLEYVDTPVWDILKYVAESSDKNGVIGFDFRVAADGKFEFFPKNSKTSAVSLSERVERCEFAKDIFAVRNKVTIYGAADKSVPLDKDGFTEILHPTEGDWSALGNGVTVAQDSTVKAFGSSSIKCHVDTNWFGAAVFTFNNGYEIDTNLYPIINFFLMLQTAFCGRGAVAIFDTAGKQMSAARNFKADPAGWLNVSVGVGVKNADEWVPGAGQTGFDWTHIKKIQVSCIVKDDLSNGSGDFWIDGLCFTGRKYSSVQEDGSSQATYGLREMVDADDELYSDDECELRAKAVLNKLKAPVESLRIETSILDFGTTPIFAGDKIHVVLPNESVDADFRVVSAEYNVDGKSNRLEVSLELGREAPLLADWVYALRSRVDRVNRR